MTEHAYCETLIRYDGPLARVLGYVRPRRLAHWLMARANLPVVGECWMRCGTDAVSGHPWRRVRFSVDEDGTFGPLCPDCGEVPVRLHTGVRGRRRVAKARPLRWGGWRSPRWLRRRTR